MDCTYKQHSFFVTNKYKRKMLANSCRVCILLDGTVMVPDECLDAAVDVEALERVVQPARPDVNRILSKISIMNNSGSDQFGSGFGPI